jgi:hypothetical protein
LTRSSNSSLLKEAPWSVLLWRWTTFEGKGREKREGGGGEEEVEGELGA